MPTPVRRMAEHMQGRWGRLDPQREGISPLTWCWPWHLPQRIFCKGRLGLGAGGKPGAGMGFYV